MAMAENGAARYIRTGIFLLAAAGLMFTVVMLLGRSGSIFRSRATLYAEFIDTSGLVVGAPVRLAGINIGEVNDILLSKDPRMRRVIVKLRIDPGYLTRIREDSIAQLTTRGLLGDVIINLTIGSADRPELEDGSYVQTKEAQGVAEILASMETVVAAVKDLTVTTNQRLHELLTPQLTKDVGRIVHSTAELTEGIEKSRGLLHDLIYDPRLADSTRAMLQHTKGIAAGVEHSLDHIDRILGRIENGGGLAHALIYGADGKQTVSELSAASKELADILREIKSGNGLVHSLIYETEEKDLVQNLTLASQLILKMVEEMNQGQGTIGGLVKDPTIYRDLVGVLGNLRRNVLLKALVRMTIKHDGLERVPQPPAEESAKR
jgi:phospholipid/cholesterol/gamma-HCH transport system substrate-binding protein